MPNQYFSYTEAENILSENSKLKEKNLDEVCKEFGEISGFVLQLLAKICYYTERTKIGNECNKKSLNKNPFLWQSYADLCNHGEKPDPKQIFQISNNEQLMQLTCDKQHIHQLHHSLIDQMGEYDQMNFSQTVTPNNINQLRNMERMEEDVTPLTTAGQNCLNNMNFLGTDSAVETPFRTTKHFKYLTSNLSPVTPSFGVLPITPQDGIKPTTLFLTPSPPSQDVNQEVNAKSISNSNKKLRGHAISGVITRREAPLQLSKPIVLTSNIAQLQRTPQHQQNQQQQQQQQQQNQQNQAQQQQQNVQNVRRSSRLFSNNYSVKENNKSPINKFVQPRSPPRKANKRLTKISSKQTLNELNEKNALISVEKSEKIETITSATTIADNKFLVNSSLHQQQQQQIIQMKRQSADGLMNLLQNLGSAYLNLHQYESKEAIEILKSKIPSHHYSSSWVQSLIALAHHEQREYEDAVRVFQMIHKNEPYRLHYMEIYSTDLWHLQKDALLSALAQDLMQHSKQSAITWCVAGNCFSAQKEHDTAIKFFNRAIQMDPEFSYSYTLLGHELVVTEELEKALACYRKAILKDPRHYNAWFGIGTIYSKQERFQLAEIHYRRALKINPKNSVILVHIGVMQFYLQKPEQAIQTLNQAILLEPKNPLCKFHRASMNFSIGKLTEALTELEELKQIVPKESVVYYLIGKIHKKLGNIDLALMHFSWATDLDPKGANNQIKDKFDSIIRSQQQSEQQPIDAQMVDDDEIINETTESAAAADDDVEQVEEEIITDAELNVIDISPNEIGNNNNNRTAENRNSSDRNDSSLEQVNFDSDSY